MMGRLRVQAARQKEEILPRAWGLEKPEQEGGEEKGEGKEENP